MNNQSTIKQVQKFIDAGVARRLDLSPQIDVVVMAQVDRINLDPNLTADEKSKLIRELGSAVSKRVAQFAPTWNFPPSTAGRL